MAPEDQDPGVGVAGDVDGPSDGSSDDPDAPDATGDGTDDDAGSPVATAFEVRSTRLARCRAEGGAVQDYDPRHGPLEPLVAGEPLGERPNLGRAVRAGQRLLRLVDAHGAGHHRAALVQRFPLAADDPAAVPGDRRGARLRAVYAGRALDGARARAELASAGIEAVLDDLAPPAADRPALEAAFSEWSSWIEAAWGGEPSAWRDDRLEHDFVVAAPPLEDGGDDEVALRARWLGDELDWHSFDREEGVALGAVGDAETAVAADLQPAPVRYPGMPHPRFWTFEEHPVDFARVEVEGSDLGRMLFVEFALTTGDDWYLVPVRLPYGTVSRVERLEVTDTFGVTTSIPAAPPSVGAGGGANRWVMYRPARRAVDGSAADPDPCLVLPPVHLSLIHI